MELAELTLASFEPLLGEPFRVHAGGETLQLILAEVTPAPDAAAPGAGRTPFALGFRGPAEPLLPQAIYPLEHEAHGPLQVFIVPVGRDAEGVLYEAVFT